MRAVVAQTGRELATSVQVADSLFARMKGLLGRTELNPGEALWIIPCKGIHTIGMRFAIDAVFLDKNNFAEVSHILEAAVKVVPDDFRVNFLLGVAYNRLGQNEQAVRANIRASTNHLRHGSEVLEQLIQSDGLLFVGAPSPAFEEQSERRRGDAHAPETEEAQRVDRLARKVERRAEKVEVERIVCAIDVGRAINPQQVLGQIQGGLIQSVGYSLLENFIEEGGRVLTPSLSTYLVPTVVDIPPEIEAIVLEIPDPRGPWGARGLGEVMNMCLAPAIAAAVHAATGVWFDEFPLTPERVLRGLGKI